MSLGKKVEVSQLDRLYFINMTVQKYVSRSFQITVDFSRCMEALNGYNKNQPHDIRIKFSAALIKAIACTYGYTDKLNRQPFRQLCSYISPFPWLSNYQSKTIDVSLMMVRPFKGVSNQTLNYPIKEADKRGIREISDEIRMALTEPEENIKFFRRLMAISSLNPFLIYLLFSISKLQIFKSLMMCPISVSILKEFPGTLQGEHINIFTLGKIDKQTQRASITWAFDHRLGFGKDFGPFLNKLKENIESDTFWKKVYYHEN